MMHQLCPFSQSVSGNCYDVQTDLTTGNKSCSVVF